MENKTQLTVSGGQTPAFVQEKLNSLAGALEYANTLLKSGIAPAHFYHKGSDGKPDYSKGKPEAVVIVLQFGSEIGMSPMQALQQLVPVNNLVSLKGDGAKALIQRSGKLASWQETEIGAQGEDDWGFKIEASRKDNGEKSSVSFTVGDAKRAGLWIDESLLQRYPNMKHSPWFKHPKRMLKYRALGFISRDLFPDVLSGIYTEEEARDMETDNTSLVVEGMAVNIAKEVRTEESNAKVAEIVNAKEAKAKKLAGATAEKVVLAKASDLAIEAIVEPNQELFENQNTGLDLNAETERLKKLSPKDVASEFIRLHEASVIPFNVESWLKHGGSKNAQDIIKVIISCHSGTLKNTLEELGIDMAILEIKTERALEEQLEIMDQLEANGVDLDMLAEHLKYSNKEEMLKKATKEQLMSYNQ